MYGYPIHIELLLLNCIIQSSHHASKLVSSHKELKKKKTHLEGGIQMEDKNLPVRAPGQGLTVKAPVGTI